MYNFIVPHLYENKTFNIALRNFIRNPLNAHKLNVKNVNIEFAYGNLPFSFWSGEINTCNGSNFVITEKEFQTFLMEQRELAYIFDCSNLLLTEQHFLDAHIKMVLSNLAYRGHYLKVSNLKIKDIIEQLYPNGFNFILSSLSGLSDVIIPFDALIEDSIFSYIDIPHFYNINMIQDIKYKNKCIYPLLSICSGCDKYLDCIYLEQQSQISFSNQSIFDKYNINYTAEDIQKEFEQAKNLGFSRFRFIAPNLNDIKKFNYALVDFFIKKEYQIELLAEVQSIV